MLYQVDFRCWGITENWMPCWKQCRTLLKWSPLLFWANYRFCGLLISNALVHFVALWPFFCSEQALLPLTLSLSYFVVWWNMHRKVYVVWPEEVSRRSKLRGGAWYWGLLDALNAKSVIKVWAGTIGLQLRTQKDKAQSVSTGIHFCWEGTMHQASVLYSTM